jgi:AraC-like DNA-binding protein
MKTKNDELMERIMKVVNKDLSNPDLDVDLLAREVGFSRVHLHRKMKEITGVAVATFIRNIRMKQAVELLKEKDRDVSQIGYAIGCDKPSNFATTFKKQYGVSPTMFTESVN